MQLRFWPPEHAEAPARSAIHPVLEQVRREDPALWAIVRSRLQEAEKPAVTLAGFEKLGWAERMPHTKNALYEMKLPVQRRKGVFRIYFCCDPDVRNRIWLLAAEHKTGGGGKQHRAVVNTADDRCRVIRQESG
jgi:hypothetical protein